MSYKIKNILTVSLFCAILVSGALISILTPDAEISYDERRKLAQLPALAPQDVMSGEYFNKLESYTTDQFAARKPFRTLKALSSLHVFLRQDFRGIYLADGSAVSMDYPLREDQVRGFISKINSVKDNLLSPEQRMYYAVIPDKNYFYAPRFGRLRMDYDKMLEMLDAGFDGMEYIDLFGVLGGGDYYKTDSHWRQERLGGVLDALTDGLALYKNPFPDEFEAKAYTPFYGVYYGQLALPLEPDSITYLETTETRSAVVSHIESGKAATVYDENLLGGADPFDVFLSGSTAVCTVTNTQNPGGGELIIFRDSFAGSLTPLLLPAYSKITLIDLRYIHPSLLPQYADFSSADILFLYSAGMINQSGALRGFSS